MTRSKDSILVVDDEPGSLRLLMDILADEGYRVRPADSGELALASVAVEPPELILLDIRMWGMDGFEICRRIKACKQCQEIPLMFISAATDVEERVKGLALGAVDFISKPFRREELIARVRTHLELGRLRAQLEMQVAKQTAKLCAAVEQLQLEVADRQRTEIALRESEERFRNMADTAPVMIWVSGPDKLCTFLNKGWLDFTGHTMERELCSGWATGVHPNDLDRCFATYSSSFDAHRSFQMEYRLRRADGEYRWVLDNGIPLCRGGEFTGYIGSCIDITEQKLAQAELRRNLDEIAHLNRVAALGELAASLAHEINQPLAAILSNAQAASRFLSGQLPDLAKVHECLTDIAADDKRAGEVIARLQEMLKKRESRASLVYLNEVVNEAVRLASSDALLRQVSVKFEPVSSLSPVLGDPIQLCQVVLNLIMNGLDAAAEQPPGDRWVLVRNGQSDGGGIELTVEDSGKGIAEGHMDRVFEPFFSTKQKGLGMGLSISRSIVRVHGGRIWAENSVKGGAVFRCVLPVAQQTAAAP